MVRHCCGVYRTVVLCGLVELVEQNMLIETHGVCNLDTTNQFRTQDFCDVILSGSVGVLGRSEESGTFCLLYFDPHDKSL
jgi:hypothetical protein